MNQLQRIEAKLDQILARLGEQPAVTAGPITTTDGGMFAPGTGHIRPWQSTEPIAPTAPAAAITNARQALHATSPTETP